MASLSMNKADFDVLVRRLHQESRRSELLNCVGKYTNKRMDVGLLRALKNGLPESIVQGLTKDSWEARVSMSGSGEKVDEGYLSVDKLHSSMRRILSFRDEMISALGVDSLYLGYPLLVHRDQYDSSNDVVAPLFLWKIQAELQSRSKELLLVRRSEFGVLGNKTLDLWLQSKGFPGLPEPVIRDEDCLSASELSQFVSQVRSVFRVEANSSVQGERIEFHSLKEMRDLLSTGWHVLEHGVLGNFKATNVSLIEDLEAYMNQEGSFPSALPRKAVPDGDPFKLAASRLDPSQSQVLSKLDEGMGIVVHGPPGTGKSTVITNVIVDQLLDHNRVLMVCQKTTALKVIQEKLEGLGLGDHVALIQNVQLDRDRVVRQARQILELEPLSMPRSSLDKEKQLLSVHKEHERHQEAHAKPVIWDWTWTDCAARWIWEREPLTFHPNHMAWFRESEANVEDLASYQGVLLEITDVQSLWKLLNSEVPEVVRNCRGWQDWSNASVAWQAKTEADLQRWSLTLEALNGWTAKSDEFDSWCTAPRWWWKVKTLISSECKALNTELNALDSGVLLRLRKQRNLNDAFALSKAQLEEFNTERVTHKRLLEQEDDVVHLLEQLARLSDRGFDPWLDSTWTLCSSSDWKGDIEQALIGEAVKERRGWDGMLTSERTHQEADRLMDELIALKKQEVCHVTRYRALEAIRDFDTQTGFKRLYNLRAGKKSGPRNSLRAIVKRDPQLFSELFPVLLTTPDVASALYPGVHGFFDLVLFDEASQVRVEESMAAGMKGKRMLVAGDQHQMPPSSYFRSEVEEDVDEGEILTDETLQSQDLQVESLLDYAIRRNDLSESFLDFHYRSKHPDLIRFSNAAFYGRLVPAPHRASLPKPILFHDVQGQYGSSRNVAEAEAMVKRIRALGMNALKSGATPSIGVATLNLPQKNEIEKQLQKARELDSDMDRGLIALEEAGMFVRNLENIQGDERDVMLIGTTFGRDAEGEFSKNMGMLIKQQGHRYLNVLVTRAKSRLEVFSSIPSQEFEPAVTALEARGENSGGPLFLTWVYFVKSMSLEDTDTTDRLVGVLEANNPSHRSEDQVSDSELALARAMHRHLPALQPPWKVGARLGGVTLELTQGKKKAMEMDFGARTLKGYQSLEAELHRRKLLDAIDMQSDQIWLPRFLSNPRKYLS